MRYSLDDDVDDAAEDLQPTATAPAVNETSADPETAPAPVVAVDTDVSVAAAAVDTVMWLQSLGLLLNQCPWHDAAAAEGAAARQSLLRPLVGLLGQLPTAEVAQAQLDSIVVTVTQVADWHSKFLSLIMGWSLLSVGKRT